MIWLVIVFSWVHRRVNSGGVLPVCERYAFEFEFSVIFEM